MKLINNLGHTTALGKGFATESLANVLARVSLSSRAVGRDIGRGKQDLPHPGNGILSTTLPHSTVVFKVRGVVTFGLQLVAEVGKYHCAPAECRFCQQIQRRRMRRRS
jgi:hypothetical protein